MLSVWPMAMECEENLTYITAISIIALSITHLRVIPINALGLTTIRNHIPEHIGVFSEICLHKTHKSDGESGKSCILSPDLNTEILNPLQAQESFISCYQG